MNIEIGSLAPSSSRSICHAMASWTMVVVVFLGLQLLRQLRVIGAQSSIGVCYGMLGDNLPGQTEAVQLIQSLEITKVRLYAPSPGALNALRNTSIQVTLGIDNADIKNLASDPSFATSWITANVLAYVPNIDFRYILVGNEVIPGDIAVFVLPAIKNMANAIGLVGLQDQIKVSTAVNMGVVATSYPPSQGSFSDQSEPFIVPIIQWLAGVEAPLMLNVYPYFAYAGNQANIQASYALFTADQAIVTDTYTQLTYKNLFDAMVDSVYAAMEKVGATNVSVVISESGWPSAGGDPTVTTIVNAQTYNNKLVRHVAQGTPKRPGSLETYVFALFNEDLKAAGVEQNWGLFYPNKQPVYPFSLF